MATSIGPPWIRGPVPRRGYRYSTLHLRVSDAERAEVADRLSKHYADGRLDQAEFSRAPRPGDGGQDPGRPRWAVHRPAADSTGRTVATVRPRAVAPHSHVLLFDRCSSSRSPRRSATPSCASTTRGCSSALLVASGCCATTSFVAAADQLAAPGESVAVDNCTHSGAIVPSVRAWTSRSRSSRQRTRQPPMCESARLTTRPAATMLDALRAAVGAAPARRSRSRTAGRRRRARRPTAALGDGAVVDVGDAAGGSATAPTELVVSSGPDAGRRSRADRPASTRRSRPATVAITINDGSISRAHLLLSVAAGLTTVTDLDSANGTTLDGDPLPAAATPVAVGPVRCSGSVTARCASSAPAHRSDCPPRCSVIHRAPRLLRTRRRSRHRVSGPADPAGADPGTDSGCRRPAGRPVSSSPSCSTSGSSSPSPRCRRS